MSKHARHLLTAKECAQLVKAGVVGRHKDGGSLYLEVKAPGQASWVYRWGPNRNLYHIGTWADVSLKEARVEHAEARTWVKQGLNPSQQRKLRKIENRHSADQTFKIVADEWLDSRKTFWSEKHHKNSVQAFRRDVYPVLGRLPVASITTAMIHEALQPVCDRAPESGARIRLHVGLVFDLARVKGLRPDNPVVIPGSTRSTGKRDKKHPALLNLKDLGDVLRRTESANTTPTVRMALWVLSRTAVRAGELLAAKWHEFDLDGDDPRWTIPRERMKTQSRAHDHAVPLSPAVVSRLKQWRAVAPESEFVFSSKSSRNKTGHISVESLEKAYRVTLELRGIHVPHGWRAAFSSNANDALDKNGNRLFDGDDIEIALDHVVGSKQKQAYDRGERWDARRALMLWWSDQLDAAERGGDVVDIRRVA